MALHFLLDAGTDAAVGDTVALTGPEAHHAAAVRRVRIGEEVTLGDGRGTWLTGEVSASAPREVLVRVRSRRSVAPPERRIILVQALAKGDRDELAVQAATELGVDGIVPWQASRSVSRWDAAKAEKGRLRWESIVREAAKQAHRAWIPTVQPLQTTAALAARARDALVLVLEPTAVESLSGLSAPGGDVTPDRRDLVLVVGPEGGIATEELAVLEAAGARAMRLGETVLRTSTAGPAALAVLNVALRRW